MAEHQRMGRISKMTPDKANDHFIGNQQDNFKDNLVFITNTLLRRKFSK